MKGTGSVLAALCAALVLATACDDDVPLTTPPDPGGDQRVPDFALRDVNPTSPTFDQDVSPRQYLGRISAWYFGSAT